METGCGGDLFYSYKREKVTVEPAENGDRIGSCRRAAPSVLARTRGSRSSGLRGGRGPAGATAALSPCQTVVYEIPRSTHPMPSRTSRYRAALGTGRRAAVGAARTRSRATEPVLPPSPTGPR